MIPGEYILSDEEIENVSAFVCVEMTTLEQDSARSHREQFRGGESHVLARFDDDARERECLGHVGRKQRSGRQ